MKCQNEKCGKEFKGRSDARYCSPACRVTANRSVTVVTANSVAVTDNPVTDKISVTENISVTEAVTDNVTDNPILVNHVPEPFHESELEQLQRQVKGLLQVNKDLLLKVDAYEAERTGRKPLDMNVTAMEKEILNLREVNQRLLKRIDEYEAAKLPIPTTTSESKGQGEKKNLVTTDGAGNPLKPPRYLGLKPLNNLPVVLLRNEDGSLQDHTTPLWKVQEARSARELREWLAKKTEKDRDSWFKNVMPRRPYCKRVLESYPEQGI